MDFKKKLITLSSIAAALALLVIAGWIFSPENNQRRAARRDLVGQKALDKASSFAIGADAKSIEVTAEGDSWSFKNGNAAYPASSEKVKAFFKALSQANELYKVSSNKDTWKNFGLEDGKKTLLLKDKSGKTLADVCVGKDDPTGKQVYVAIAGKDTVYAVSNVFTSYVRADEVSWSDLRLFPAGLDKRNVQEIEVKADFPGEKDGEAGVKIDYRLVRDAKKPWKVAGNDTIELDTAKVDALVNGIVGMDAESFVLEDGKAAAALLIADERGSVVVRTGKGEEYRLAISKKGSDDKHVMRLDGKDYLYNLSRYSVTYYLKTLDSLKAEKKEKAVKADKASEAGKALKSK
jgi:hypothetical protein